MTTTIYISLTENNAALSSYDVASAYLFYVVDPNTLQFTTEYYSNTAYGIPNFVDDENFIPNLQIFNGGTFNDYQDGYFNYSRFDTITASGLISEQSTIIFNLSGIQDSTFNIIKIVFDKFGDGSTLISTEKDFYLSYNNSSALDILNETNEYKSPKYRSFVTQYKTINPYFTTTYTPIISAYRDNGVVNVINVTLTVAKNSLLQLTQDFRIIDTYQFSDKIIIKMQNPVDNQIYFTTLSAG